MSCHVFWYLLPGGLTHHLAIIAWGKILVGLHLANSSRGKCPRSDLWIYCQKLTWLYPILFTSNVPSIPLHFIPPSAWCEKSTEWIDGLKESGAFPTLSRGRDAPVCDSVHLWWLRCMLRVSVYIPTVGRPLVFSAKPQLTLAEPPDPSSQTRHLSCCFSAASRPRVSSHLAKHSQPKKPTAGICKTHTGSLTHKCNIFHTQEVGWTCTHAWLCENIRPTLRGESTGGSFPRGV